MLDEGFLNGGTCTDSFCPASPEELSRLFGQDDELQPSEEECRVTAAAIALAEREVMRSQVNSFPASSEPPQVLPKTIPLCIQLGPDLNDPAEQACAEAVAKHLSSECSRVVSVTELKGLMLFLWSEHDIEGIPVSDYLNKSRPLQGLVVHPRDSLSQVGAELRGMLGRSFEFVAA
jgi:hypothetical protein